MLYQIQDAMMRSLSPLHDVAEYTSFVTGFIAPAFLPVTREIQARLHLLERLTRHYDKPAFNIGSVQTASAEVRVTEEVVESLPFCNLRHFKKSCDDKGPQVLVVAPLSGHHSTLLRPTIMGLLQAHDVYVTDWVDAREVPLHKGRFDLSSYTEYVQHFIRNLGPDIHVLAVCQPSVPVLAAVSLMEQNAEPFVPKSMTLIAGPVDVRQSPTAVNKFANEHDLDYFKTQLIERVPLGYPGAMRQVYPGFLQLTVFVMMNQEKHEEAYIEYYRAIRDGNAEAAHKHEQFYDEYNAVLDMPAEYYLETIEKIFIRPDLATGSLQLCDQLVDPSAIERTALLTVEGSKDDITGAGQTYAAHTLCKALPDAMREHIVVDGAGHYGAFSGTKFLTVTLPAIERFIAQHA